MNSEQESEIIHKHLDGHISARILEKEYGADIGGAATHGSKT